ncbi:hypothetical protein [Lentzea sp. NPDC003310]|uniref:hypothetical protein n=1 Tax=Lentzea sp. NPDC003310 TaxID=3154447 RepID=UPI0033B7B71F
MTNNVQTKSHPALLWTALVLSALANAGMSFVAAGGVIHIVFGVLTLAFGAGLVAHYRRR